MKTQLPSPLGPSVAKRETDPQQAEIFAMAYLVNERALTPVWVFSFHMVVFHTQRIPPPASLSVPLPWPWTMTDPDITRAVSYLLHVVKNQFVCCIKYLTIWTLVLLYLVTFLFATAPLTGNKLRGEGFTQTHG